VPLTLCSDSSDEEAARGSPVDGVGAFRLLLSPERCMVASTQGSNAGDAITMQSCNKRTDLQLDVSDDATIRLHNKPELCLATNSQEMATGDVVLLAPCANDDSSQMFHFSMVDGSIRSVESPFLCFETTGLVVALDQCNDDPLQFDMFDDGCSASSTAPITDFGANDEYRGWYDIQDCGVCRDYCRWLGSGSGGDPAVSTVVGSSHWSCALAGSVREFTLPNYFQSWNFSKCDVLSDVIPAAIPANGLRSFPSSAEDDPQVPRQVPRKSLRRRNFSQPSSSFASTAPTSVSRQDSSDSRADPEQEVGNQTTMGQQLVSWVPTIQSFVIPLGILGGLMVIAVVLWIMWRQCGCRDSPPEKPRVHVPRAPGPDVELEDSMEPGRTDYLKKTEA